MTIPTEHQEQAALVKWFCAQHPTYKRLLFAIPNGAWLAGNAKQRAQQMSKLRREGLHSGVPDLLLAIPRQGYHGLFIEMKRRKGGKLSMQQEAYQALLREQGYLSEVCYGADEAIMLVKGYLV